MRRLLFLLLITALTGCHNLEDRNTTVIVGATLLDGAGDPPLVDSVVVVSGPKLRLVGTRAQTPIPQNSQRVDASGMFLLPVRVPTDIDHFLQRNAASRLAPRETIRQAGTRTSVEPGSPADLVLLTSDPSAANSNWTSARRFMVNGNWIQH